MSLTKLRILVPISKRIDGNGSLTTYLLDYFDTFNDKLLGMDVHTHNYTYDCIDMVHLTHEVHKMLKRLNSGIMSITNVRYDRHYLNNDNMSLVVDIIVTK